MTTDIKVLLNNYREKLVLLKSTMDRIGKLTDSEIIEAISLKKDIAELEIMVTEQTKEK